MFKAIIIEDLYIYVYVDKLLTTYNVSIKALFKWVLFQNSWKFYFFIFSG